MGCAPSHPITRSPIIYEPNTCFNVTGTRKTHGDFGLGNTEFQLIQEQYWDKLLYERRQTALTKRKFQEMGEKDFRALIDEFPDFNEGDILDLRLQFQTFDLNQDGIIDYQELMQVLDDLGDRSDHDVREQYFQQIDKDGSGAIDFEEFLALIHELRKTSESFGSNEYGQIGNLCKRGTDNIQRVRKLSVAKQLLIGLF
ncbi:troponin C, isotype alpha-like [Montipora foliosa]|uniref:troponin C, isotype alpha-like n=2 Tax=Montipora TaxID=46703 RepID=UPI0035F16338